MEIKHIFLIILVSFPLLPFLFLGLFSWNWKVICFHKLHTGGGAMGDATSCEKCNLDMYGYPEIWVFIFKLFGRVKE